jgi:hypothetical protein
MKSTPKLSRRREGEIIKGWTAAFNKLVAYRVALVGLPFYCVGKKALAGGAPMFNDDDSTLVERLLDDAVSTNFQHGQDDKRTQRAVVKSLDAVMRAAKRIEFHQRPKTQIKRKNAKVLK